MKLRNVFALFAVVALVACGGAAEDTAVDPAPAATPAESPMDDEAAIRALADDFVLHYNMHHAAVVAGNYTDDAVVLAANGSVFDTAEARVAGLEAEMAANPTLTVETLDVMVFGDGAAAYGSYRIDMAPEGAEPTSISGHWMDALAKIDGEWKISALLTNYDSDPPENLPEPMSPDATPPDLEDHPLAELTSYYATHFNMGHGGMVASRYAEDAVAAFAGGPLVRGRAAVEERMATIIEERGNPQLTIHVVAAEEAGDGYALGGGWYEMAGAAGNSSGTFMMLARATDGGNYEIVWLASNGLPAE